MRYLRFLLLFALIGFYPVASAELGDFADEDEQKRYQSLLNEIRCPVCQGQSIGGSNADLAKDLRLTVQNMILRGSSDDDIRRFMVERYGDFVVFKPPFNKTTYLLWFTPFLFLLFALFFLIKSISNKQKAEIKPKLLAKAKDLLK